MTCHAHVRSVRPMAVETTLDDLRRMAVTRSLGRSTTLARAIDALGFVQADPIRAPARAQDLTLRPRVRGYRAGDLERLYPSLDVEEDVFINYGFVTRSLHALMHPRPVASLWPSRPEHAGPGRDRLRAGARRRASARRRCALLARHGDELLGRLIECHHSPARRIALQGPAARRPPRGRHPDLCPARAWRRPGGTGERRARMDALVDTVVRTYAPTAGGQPLGRGPAPPLRRPAVARRVAVGARARTPAARARAGRWGGLVLAGG